MYQSKDTYFKSSRIDNHSSFEDDYYSTSFYDSNSESNQAKNPRRSNKSKLLSVNM